MDLNLYRNIRVRSLLLFEPSMDLPVQDRTSKTLFAILLGILDLSHVLLVRMYGFSQLFIVTVILNMNIF